MRVSQADMEMVKFRKPRMYYDNLYGNKKLSDNMNEIINGNLDQLFPLMLDQFNEPFNKLMVKMINSFLSKVSLEEMFPDNKERFQ